MPPSPLPSPSETHAADGHPRPLPAPSDDPAAGPQCVRVGVVPAAAATAHARLLAALEAVYPVRFEPRAAGDWRELDAVVAFGALATGPPPLPLLRAAAAESPAGAPQPLRLADDPRLERPLRGALLHDAHVAGLAAERGGEPLATGPAGPLWVTRTEGGVRQDLVACAPAELEPEEALRERLTPGRSLALLALSHFLRGLTAERGWRPPPLRAAFVFDDPNLHWPTYGHVRYGELIAHAARHGYHVAIAMVPLDAWLIHPRAARLFRESGRHLSLCVHGNDHSGAELWRLRGDVEARAVAAQALRRIGAFERRTGLAVSRVMVPPHERVSEHSARALLALGYEAIANTRPYSWAREEASAGSSWLVRPRDAGPLVGWHSVEVVAGGLPVLLRAGFDYPREDLVLRAYLGQPLILYGHHADVRGGLDVLAGAAADINALGDVRWGPAAELARLGAETCRAGSLLRVRPRARRVQLDLPDGVERVLTDPAVLAPSVDGFVRARVDAGALIRARVGEPLDVRGGSRLELELEPAAQAEAPATARRPRLWPLARRLAVEGRDRTQAALARS